MATLTGFLKGIADALRTKKGTSDPIPAPNFAQEILGIQTGTDTSDATATAADILSGKTAYGAAGKITGTIKSVAGKTVTPGTTEKTAVAAKSYTKGAVKVAGDTNLVPENIKSGVSIFGVLGTLIARGDFNLVYPTVSSETELTFKKPSGTYTHFVLVAYTGGAGQSVSLGDGTYTMLAVQVSISDITITRETVLFTDGQGGVEIEEPRSTAIIFGEDSVTGGNFTDELSYGLYMFN